MNQEAIGVRQTCKLLFSCCVHRVGEVFVQGDEGHVSGVAQGVHAHGVIVRHEEKEEEEIEQEVVGEKEENAQTTMRMSMDGMKVKRQVRAALSQSEM